MYINPFIHSSRSVCVCVRLPFFFIHSPKESQFERKELVFERINSGESNKNRKNADEKKIYRDTQKNTRKWNYDRFLIRFDNLFTLENAFRMAHCLPLFPRMRLQRGERFVVGAVMLLFFLFSSSSFSSFSLNVFTLNTVVINLSIHQMHSLSDKQLSVYSLTRAHTHTYTYFVYFNFDRLFICFGHSVYKKR